MLPPGRRRAMRLLPITVALLLYLTTFASAASAVLGIDLGTEYIKAALVKPGIPLEIVLSKDSKRKEVSALAFKPPKGEVAAGSYPERSYGSDALALAARFPGEVYPNLKQLLGIPVESSVVKDYARRYPALGLEKSSRGFAAFKSRALHKEEGSWTVEELLAMELINVKENAQSMAGNVNRVSSAVFTIPAYYTADERKALQVAADLAGLNVLGMTSDGLAVGLHYATSRTFPSVTDGAKPEYHLVFDMGAGSTVASVLRMQGRTIKEGIGKKNKAVQEVAVIGAGWDRTLGGDALNMVIVDDMVTKFTESKKFKALGKTEEDVRAHGRAMARLFKEAEKVRQVLSANKQTSASFEELFEEVDLRYKFSRDEFEAATSHFAARLETPITTALKAANLSFDELTSVILHGGMTRTPFVQAKLEVLVGDTSKLRTNVNADEAAVFGAAFRAAQISPSFRVKEIVAGDAASYATFLQYSVEGKQKTQKLFTPTSTIGVTKDVPFTQLEDLSFKLYQARGANDESGSAPPTYTFTTKNIAAGVKTLLEKPGCAKVNITNTFSIRLNLVNGLPEVLKGTLSCPLEEQEKKSVVDGVKDIFRFGKKGDEESIKAEEVSSSSSSSDSSSTSSSASAKASKAAEKKKRAEKKVEILTIEFDVTCEGCVELTKEDLDRMKHRLIAFDAADKSRRQREEDMNNLESFIYKARDILPSASFLEYSTSSERSTLEKLVDAASEWMYEKEAQTATADVLKMKLKEMTDIVNPVNKRQKEWVARPAAIAAYEKALEETTGFVGMIKNGIENAKKAAESATSAAASAAEEASKSAASVASKVTGESDNTDDLDDLDEEIPEEPAAVPTPNIADFFSGYKDDDLTEAQKLYEDAKAYLNENIAKQAKLAVTDNPAFDVAELETMAKKLNDQVMKIVGRNVPKWTPPKSSSSSKSKSKSRSKDRKSSSSKSSSSASSGSSTSASSSSSAKAKSSAKDEL